MKKHTNILLLICGLVAGIIGVLSFVLYNQANKKPLYVALGDSVAAGAGLRTSSDQSGCDRNDESYPNLIAKKKDYELKNLACSGATIEQGILGAQKVETGEQEAQFDELAKLRTPELITITIGANDIDWTEPIMNCFLSECGAETDTADIDNKLSKLSINLGIFFDKLKNFYSEEPPRVVMTKYYRIITGSQQQCPQFVGISSGEADWLDAQFTKLNDVIAQSASKYPFVTTVDLNFEQNSICSYESWIQGISAKAPLHPNNAGQEAIKSALLKTL